MCACPFRPIRPQDNERLLKGGRFSITVAGPHWPTTEDLTMKSHRLFNFPVLRSPVCWVSPHGQKRRSTCWSFLVPLFSVDPLASGRRKYDVCKTGGIGNPALVLCVIVKNYIKLIYYIFHEGHLCWHGTCVVSPHGILHGKARCSPLASSRLPVPWRTAS